MRDNDVPKRTAQLILACRRKSVSVRRDAKLRDSDTESRAYAKRQYHLSLWGEHYLPTIAIFASHLQLLLCYFQKAVNCFI